MLRRILVPLALTLCAALTACGPSSADDDDDGTGEPCTGSDDRCIGTQYQECRNGEWTVIESCVNQCNADLGGCIDCQPNVNACNGNTVTTCTSDGHFGTPVMTCPEGSECSGGSCQRACSADGVDLIYVVDETYRLLSFDPRLVGVSDPFRVIGTLSCNAGATIPEFGTGPATPFSMAVDRDAIAWVLYSSGQIFHVSTQNGACTATGFAPRQNSGGRQWDLFGMGFVTDTPGGDTERLWVGGGNVDALAAGDLGSMDKTQLTIQRVGALSATQEYSPELTGLGDATVWGFYPGLSNAFVQEINKTTGAGVGPQRNIPGGLGGTVSAWAFAQWGGKFYIFVTTTDILTENSTVRTIDRQTGAYQLVSQNLPYTIVGAGVSTCAPVVIGRQLPWEENPAMLPIDGSNFMR